MALMTASKTDDFTDLEKAERDVIKHHIHLQGGNLTAVAQNAGLSRYALYSKLNYYGLWSLVEKMRKAA